MVQIDWVTKINVVCVTMQGNSLIYLFSIIIIFKIYLFVIHYHSLSFLHYSIHWPHCLKHLLVFLINLDYLRLFIDFITKTWTKDILHIGIILHWYFISTNWLLPSNTSPSITQNYSTINLLVFPYPYFHHSIPSLTIILPVLY